MSAGAALQAMNEGVTNVAALRGGWAAWQQVGYPVEGTTVPTPTPTTTALPASGGTAELSPVDAQVKVLQVSHIECPSVLDRRKGSAVTSDTLH